MLIIKEAPSDCSAVTNPDAFVFILGNSSLLHKPPQKCWIPYISWLYFRDIILYDIIHQYKPSSYIASNRNT